MTKKKEPQMAHPNAAQDALANKIDSLIDEAAESASEEEVADRERQANEIVENVRARAARRERA